MGIASTTEPWPPVGNSNSAKELEVILPRGPAPGALKHHCTTQVQAAVCHRSIE